MHVPIEAPSQVGPAVVLNWVRKPDRLNFAGVCLRCDARDCMDPDCIAWHAASCWAICPDCDGLCWRPGLQPCGCFFGVVEMYPPSRRLAAI